MGSTVGPRYVTGVAVANDGDLAIRKVGFQPKRIRVFNKTSLATLEWNDQLDAAGAEWIKQVSAGTRTLDTGGEGITLLAGDSSNPPGFQIGNAVDINDTTTELLVWEAWG